MHRTYGGFEVSWEQLLEPHYALNELVAQNQNLMRVPLDVLSKAISFF